MCKVRFYVMPENYKRARRAQEAESKRKNERDFAYARMQNKKRASAAATGK